VILTASSPIQQASELGPSELSVFTHHLVAGLASGDADLDRDGRITFDELYDYVYERVTESSPQTPQKWCLGEQGSIVVAKSRQDPVRTTVKTTTPIDQARPRPRLQTWAPPELPG
jgi:uncharacterized caspase-like protein